MLLARCTFRRCYNAVSERVTDEYLSLQSIRWIQYLEGRTGMLGRAWLFARLSPESVAMAASPLPVNVICSTSFRRWEPNGHGRGGCIWASGGVP